jgi:hypothetical protein
LAAIDELNSMRESIRDKKNIKDGIGGEALRLYGGKVKQCKVSHSRD